MEGGKIFGAITAIMNELGAIEKKKRLASGPNQYNYRGVDDVMNALNPALIKNGVFIVPEVLEETREERQTSKGGNLLYSILKIRFRFYAEDGSHIDAVTIGEGMDSGDKASNKAMSVAFKYACFQIFCIPTEEMIDPDATVPDSSHKMENGGNPSRSPASSGSSAQSPVTTASTASPAGSRMSNDRKNQEMIEAAGKDCIDRNKIATIRSVIKRKGVHESSILERYKIENLANMTVSDWTKAMKILNGMADVERSA